MEASTDTRSPLVLDESEGVFASSQLSGQSGSLSRPARHTPIRGSGLRRRSNRFMREIIRALKENMKELEREEQEATGRTFASYCSSSSLSDATSVKPEPLSLRPAPARPKAVTPNRNGSISALTSPAYDRNLMTNRPARITLLSSQDLCTEELTVTELTCDFCHCAFCLQEGGASFEGKAACSNCEQRLNRDVVLPKVCHLRPQMREHCDVTTCPHHPKRPA